jgi:hypothetical protein
MKLLVHWSHSKMMIESHLRFFYGHHLPLLLMDRLLQRRLDVQFYNSGRHREAGDGVY